MAAALLFAAPARAADLIVATDTAFVPFEFKQGDKYVGFDIDLWDAVAKDIGVTYKLQPMDFNGIIPALQTKQVDVGLAGITIKDERKKAVDFSDGYYDSGFLLMVPSSSDIKGPADLKARSSPSRPVPRRPTTPRRISRMPSCGSSRTSTTPISR